MPELFKSFLTIIRKNISDFLLAFTPLPSFPTSFQKRILIFNWRDRRHLFSGGAEVYIQELAKRWVKMGFHVTLFCGSDRRSLGYEIIEGVEIFRRGGFYLVYLWAFLYYLFKFRGKYDVIIDCENGIPFFTPLYAKEKKYLLIHHVHQEVFRKSLRFPLASIATFLEVKLMPFIYKNIQVITVSPSSQFEIIDNGLAKVKPFIIYNGVDLRKYKPGKKSKTPVVLYLGRLKYYKNLPIFIKAAKKILQKLPNVKFAIAGDGEEKNKLIQLVKSLHLGKKIKFLGKVTEAEKVRLYQKAWVFVNPSMMEGWGITTIEANACATPVIAADVPGLRDSVKNPHVGYLVADGDVNGFANAITKLITDRKLRRKKSKFAFQWAKNFSWEKSAKRGLKILFH